MEEDTSILDEKRSDGIIEDIIETILTDDCEDYIRMVNDFT